MVLVGTLASNTNPAPPHCCVLCLRSQPGGASPAAVNGRDAKRSALLTGVGTCGHQSVPVPLLFTLAGESVRRSLEDRWGKRHAFRSVHIRVRGPGSRSQRRLSVSPSRPLVWHRELPRLGEKNKQKKPTNKLRDLGVAAGEPSLSALEPGSDFGYRRPPNPGFSLLTH